MYYEYLGIKPNATKDEIKRAYKNKAKELHPDKNKTGDDKEFKQLNKINEILSNPQKRKDYDCFGENLPNYNINYDIWELELEITLEDIYNKTSKELLLNYNIDCQKCLNVSAYDDINKCNQCENGVNYYYKKVEIKCGFEPARIKLPNRNYLIIFKVKKHEYFELEKFTNNLILTLQVPLFHNLCKSFYFKCKFLDNSDLIIKPDFIITNNSTYIIKNKGLTPEKDLIVNFILKFPKELSEKKCNYLRKIFKIPEIPLDIIEQRKNELIESNLNENELINKISLEPMKDYELPNCVQQ